MKSRDLQPRLLYSIAIAQNQRADKELSRKEKKLKKFILTKPLLYVMLKGLI